MEIITCMDYVPGLKGTFRAVQYVMVGLTLKFTSEMISYYSQHMYHELCCQNFTQFFLMRGSSICSTMKNMDYYISPKVLSTYFAAK